MGIDEDCDGGRWSSETSGQRFFRWDTQDALGRRVGRKAADVDDGGGHGSLIHSRCGGRRSKVEVGSWKCCR